MPYRIIGDSCTDLPESLKKDPHIRLVPLTLYVDDYLVMDDESFCQSDFLKRVKASPNAPKSACPSPEDYMKHFDCEGDVYVVTLSSPLSGSYNSAMLAKKLYAEEHPDKNIEVIDSRSASVGQALIAMKIKELAEMQHPFKTVTELVRAFRDEMKTKFVLESLDALRKNGRLSGIQAMIVSALNIKPVMGATPEGTICKVGQARGIRRALNLIAEAIEADVVRPAEKILGISHCNNYERAELVKQEILKRVPFADSFIVNTAGISSLYASDGGIIAAY